MKSNRMLMITILLLLVIFTFFCLDRKEYAKEKVIISLDSMATTKDNISITMKTKKNYKIYYSLDGSIPNKKSNLYKKPIKLNSYSTPDNLSKEENSKNIIGDGIYNDKSLPRGTVLRAVAVAPNGKYGEVETRTYFIGLDLVNYFGEAAVVSIVTDPDNLLDYNDGIMVKGSIYDEWSKSKKAKKILNDIEKRHLVQGNYTQKGKDWEREAVIDFFDSNNKLTWSMNGGIRLKGYASRQYSQKSFNIYFRKDYGDKKLKYTLFSDARDINNEVINEYKSFSLRNGGNENKYLKFKDLWLQDLVKDRKVDTQSGRIAVLFLNGEYWGVYVLQEKYSDDYFASHYNLDKDNIIVIKDNEVDEGKGSDIKLYNELMEYANKDLSNEDIYNEFLSIVDIESMIDYYAIEIYIGNADWGNVDKNNIMKNTQLWRVREKCDSPYCDGKWRWSLYDLEYSSSLYKQSKTSYDYDTIARARRVQPLFDSAMNNDNFREAFYNTLREIGSTNYNKYHVSSTLDSYVQKWNPYYYNDWKRFGNNMIEKEQSIKLINEFFDNRYDYIVNK